MRWVDFGWFAVATAVAACLTWRVRLYSLAHGVLDVPNARSSHSVAIARGGGLAIMITAILGVVISASIFDFGVTTAAALGIGGLLVGAVGYADDHWSLGVLPRIGIHILAAAFAVHAIFYGTHGPFAAAELTDWVALPMSIVAVVWSINLFNFMDGIDGIAASQALFVMLASGLLVAFGGGVSPGSSMVLLVSAGACLGFLFWNWPPAKIFMGDVGSGFLGFWLAAVAVWLYATDLLSIWASITLNSIFIADSTMTLLRRMLRGERWYEAHRSHAYQILACKWNSHLKVTISLVLVNVAIVLPLSVASILWSRAAPAIAVSCVFVLACVFAYVGAGSKATG